MPTGSLATYDMTTGLMLDFEPAIALLSPADVPLLAGSDESGASILSFGPCFEKKVEWQDEELLLPKSLINGTSTTGATFITVTTDERLRFSTGDELLVDSGERLRVTAYGSTAHTLEVTRGLDSTSPGTIASGSVVITVANLLPEGSDPEAARAVDRNARYNMTQIFGPMKVHVTASENAVKKYGLTSTEFDHQAANRLKEMMIQLEHAILYGLRIEDTSSEWRAMGGWSYYITTNVATGTELTESAFLDLHQLTYAAGGTPDRAVMGPKQKRTASAWTTGLDVNINRGDRARGQIVSTYESDFGVVTLVLDRNVKNTDLFLVSRDQVEVCTLRPFQLEMLAKTGDSQVGQLVGEKSQRFRRQSHAGMFNALT